MKNLKQILVLLSCFLFLGASQAVAGKKDPVAILSQVTGTVEYQKAGKKKWKKVRRNKFLFSGYTIKVGKDGAGKLTDKKTGKSYDLTAGNEIKVKAKGVKATKGELKASAAASSALAANLMKKFDKSQSYTTVRRSHKKVSFKIDAARALTVLPSDPYVVWENVGNEYNYKLSVGGDTYDVPAGKDTVVKAKIKPFQGTKIYKIDVYKGSKKVLGMKPFKKRGKKEDRSLTWLDEDNSKQVQESVSALKAEYPDNGFMLGNYYEDQNLYVAAMTQYRQYLKENPDEIEMAPYLFRVYKKLKLNKTYKTELEEYKAQLLE